MKKLSIAKVIIIFVAQAFSQIQPTGLVASYPFDGNSNDYSIYSNHGLATAVSYTSDMTGKPNGACQFNGVNSNIIVPNAPSLGLTNGLTIAAWIRADITPQSYGASILCKGSATGGVSYALDFNVDNDLRLFIRPNGGLYECQLYDWLDQSKVGTWHFIAATIDSFGVAKLYDNCIVIRSGNFPAMIPNNHELSIGNRQSSAGAYDMPYKGAIDDLQLYNRALSVAELQAIYNNKIFPFNADSNTVALWHFNEGYGDTAHDISGNNNHLKLRNTQWVTGLYNGAVELNGINADGIAKLSSSLKLPSKAISLEACVMPYTLNNQWQHVIASHGTYGMSFHYGHPAFYLGGINGWWTPDNYDAPTNQWLHVLMQYDGNTQQIFLNDSLIAEQSINGTIVNENLYDIRVGGDIDYSTEGFLFCGKIDEVRISNIARKLEKVPQIISIPSPTLNRTPTFRWHPLSGTSAYTIQIDTSASFATTFISVPTSDTFFTPLTNLPVHTIYWRVGAGQPIHYSAVSSFTIQDPNIPVLIPYTPNPTLEKRPKLMWHTVVGASDYRIQISRDTTFADPDISLLVTDTSFTPLTNLVLGTAYWRVSSNLNVNFSPFESVFIQPDTIPFLYAFKGANTLVRRPQFRWKPVTRATSYRIQIDTAKNFSSPLASVEITDTTFTPLANLNYDLYFWRVSCDLNLALYSPADSLNVIQGLDGEPGKETVVTQDLTALPNPFNPATTISFSNPTGNASVFIINVNGKIVSQYNNLKESRITWSGANQSSGVYIVKVFAGGKTFSKRICLVK